MDEENQEKNPDDIIKILVASDIHLGYAEKDAIREHDSFNAFEEVLTNAVKHDVDFILLGGDLFHECKPSVYCINRCIQLIKRYCFGDKIIGMEFLSEGFGSLRNAGNVNYEDPNLNISFPIFSIHGNHDDLSGSKQVSAMDILSSTGLINYFGQWNDLSTIEISPLIIRKGATSLALYGLSHIHDQRLARLFHDNKVHFKPPPGDGYLHVLVLHQNRANRGSKNFIPIECLPDFLDLVIWGHEHDCLIEPIMEKNIFICQPGSTVATSLAAGEALDKHCGLLLVHKGEFIIRPQPLHSVRPFIFDTYDISSSVDRDDDELSRPSTVKRSRPGSSTSSRSSKLDTLVRGMGTLHPGAAESMRMVSAKVDEMIEQAKKKYQGPKKEVPLPLIRLQVKYANEYQAFNTIQFGQHYNGIVANPEDMVKLKEVSKKGVRSKTGELDVKVEVDEDADPQTWADNIESVLTDFFNDDANKDILKSFSANSLIKALSQFVKKDDNDAFTIAVELEIQTITQQLKEMQVPEETIADAIEQISKSNTASNKLEEAWKRGDAPSLLTSRMYDEVDNIVDDDDFAYNPTPVKNDKTNKQTNGDLVIIDSDDDLLVMPSPIARGRGRGARGGRGSRGPRGPRGAKK